MTASAPGGTGAPVVILQHFPDSKAFEPCDSIQNNFQEEYNLKINLSTRTKAISGITEVDVTKSDIAGEKRKHGAILTNCGSFLHALHPRFASSQSYRFLIVGS